MCVVSMASAHWGRVGWGQGIDNKVNDAGLGWAPRCRMHSLEMRETSANVHAFFWGSTPAS